MTHHGSVERHAREAKCKLTVTACGFSIKMMVVSGDAVKWPYMERPTVHVRFCRCAFKYYNFNIWYRLRMLVFHLETMRRLTIIYCKRSIKKLNSKNDVQRIYYFIQLNYNK